MTLNIILTADKIPHEVPKIHMPHLISHKKAKVLTKSRLYQYFCLSAFIFVVGSSRPFLPPLLIRRRQERVRTYSRSLGGFFETSLIILFYQTCSNKLFHDQCGI